MTIQLDSVMLLASILLVGPAAAIVIHAIAAAWSYRDNLSRAIFNVSWPIIGTGLGAAAATLLLTAPLSSGSPTPSVALGATTLAAVMGLTNLVTLAIILRLTDATPVRSTVRHLGPQMAPAYLGYALGAFLLVVLWDAVGLGWFAAVLLLPSLAVAQWGLLQHAGERRTYEVMLRGLVEALDIRAPGARADSELGAQVAIAVAEQLRLPAREVEAVGAAARLHDIGLLALEPPLLDEVLDGGAGSTEVLRSLVRHPQSGVDLLHGVSRLRGALPAVAGHHELWEGTGYPAGLKGPEIPLGARVVTLVDVWTSCVQPRHGDPLSVAEALDRCEALAGTALDPACVAALREVHDRHPELLEPLVPGREVDQPGGWSPSDQADPAMTHWVAAETVR